jgi:NAD(P)-dependent dehydrogenase (short-subunit alcohol dehydrogenase family)
MVNIRSETVNRVCLFTGASGTLGRAFCTAHARDYHIAALYSTTELWVPSQQGRLVDPLALDEHLAQNDVPVFAVQCDLMRPHECERVLDLVLARFGAVDLLVNAAAYAHWSALAASSKVVESAAAQFRMNATVPLEMATELVRRCWRDRKHENELRKRNIVNVSSLAASQLFPDRGQSVYAASKAALSTLTIHMASEFQCFGVRVNAVEPDSFPKNISTESVVKAIWDFDSSGANGEIARLCASKNL